MINKLTAEQIAKIPGYFEKWRKIGHEYTVIDREKAIKLLKKYLGYADIKPKYFFFFDSPMVCELAINIMKKFTTNKLGSQLDSQLYRQLSSQLYSQLYSQLDRQLSSQLDSQLDRQLSSQLSSQLRSQLSIQLSSQLYSQLDIQLYSQLSSQLDIQLYSQLYSQLDIQLSSQLRSQLYRQLSSQLDSQLYSQLSRQLSSQLDSQKLEYFQLGYFYQEGNINSGYLAFYDFLASEVKELEGKEVWEKWKVFKQITTELHYFFVFKDFVFCSEKPKQLNFKGNSLHCETGRAVEYGDTYGLYVLNGVSVPDWMVTKKAEEIDPQEVLKLPNVEQRREGIRKIGIERFAQKLGAKSIDKKEISIDGVSHPYEVLEINLGQQVGNATYLKMKNPSVEGVYHLECCDPKRTVDDALEFRNGTKEIPVSIS